MSIQGLGSVAALFNREQSKRNSSVGTSLWMAPVSEERKKQL